MTTDDLKQTTHRRGFLGTLASGAAALGLATLASPFKIQAQEQKKPMKTSPQALNPADVWFSKVKGKHRMIFDATRPHEIFIFAWPAVFMMTNDKTGTPPSDCGIVVVLRHDAIPYAFEDRLWEKYKFGEHFKADDPATKTAATRNPFWRPKPGDFKVPGIGNVEIGLNELQDKGVMFCVCDAAITVNSAVVAEKLGKEAAEIKKDWMSGLLPGVQPVPSGVWAVGRAQEHGCQYCFAG